MTVNFVCRQKPFQITQNSAIWEIFQNRRNWSPKSLNSANGFSAKSLAENLAETTLHIVLPTSITVSGANTAILLLILLIVAFKSTNFTRFYSHTFVANFVSMIYVIFTETFQWLQILVPFPKVCLEDHASTIKSNIQIITAPCVSM